MPAETFYTTVSAISFTLLGLWWVVVQTNEAWRYSLDRRRMAYAVSLHFLLPGTMSVLSIIAPDATWLWRATFVLAGLAGVIATGYVVRAIREDRDSPRLARLIEIVAIPVYGLVTVVAAVPELVTSLGIDLRPLEVEGIIVAILLFLGVQVAWILMVEPPKPVDDEAPTAG